MRYMWLPYTDSVVVVQVNPDGPPAKPSAPQHNPLAVIGTDSSSSGSGSSMSAYGDIVQEDTVDYR